MMFFKFRRWLAQRRARNRFNEYLNAVTKIPVIARMTLPEGHPDAVLDPDTGLYMECDAAFKKRFKQFMHTGTVP